MERVPTPDGVRDEHSEWVQSGRPSKTCIFVRLLSNHTKASNMKVHPLWGPATTGIAIR